MDRREAIEIATGILKQYRRYAIREATTEALDLAIEALKGDLHCPKCGTIVRDGRQYHDLVYRGEAEPIKGNAESATTTHGRLIDADALKEYIYTDEHPYNNKWDIEAVEWEDIENAPTIVPGTPTERTGEWAVAHFDHVSAGKRPRTLYCSNCNWLTSFPSAWCPNCGAKMNKGGDTE